MELLWLLAEMAADCSEVMLLDLLPSPSRSPLSPTESTGDGKGGGGYNAAVVDDYGRFSQAVII